jgi:rubrerythrin
MESTDQSTPEAKLINILQLAYSGELAAAYAYRGHWHSLSDPDDRAQVKKIEEEEWHHRKLVGEMLQSRRWRWTKQRARTARHSGWPNAWSAMSRFRLVCADVWCRQARESKHCRV